MSNDDLVELTDISAPSKPKTLKHNISSIQGLRGLAAMFVAMAHLHAVELKLGGPVLFGNWALGGFGGVDLFFVISGFVMVWSNFKSQPTPAYVGRFWTLRAIRIYPLWWLVMGAIFAVYIIHPNWVYKSHAEHPDILKSFLLIPQSTLPLHAVGWTLIHELWFYFVFGFILFAPKRLMPTFLGLWAIVAIMGAVAINNPAPLTAIIFHPLTLEFIMGAFVAYAVSQGHQVYSRIFKYAGIILLVLSFTYVSGYAQDFFAAKWSRVLFFGVPSAILVYGFVCDEISGSRTPKPFIHLGDWSYALYLIHVPVFAACGRLFARFSRDGLLDNFIFDLIAFVAAIIAAAILHICFEKPILGFAHKLLKPKKAKK